jgi:hypothetical protein
MRKVNPLTRKRAFLAIRAIGRAVVAGEQFVTYSDLATRLAMPNRTGRGLGKVLDEAAAMCRDRGLPDVTAVVVTKESVERGEPFPSLDSFVDGVWPISGLSLDDVRAEQVRVQTFDWRAVRELQLAEVSGSL